MFEKKMDGHVLLTECYFRMIGIFWNGFLDIKQRNKNNLFALKIPYLKDWSNCCAQFPFCRERQVIESNCG